MIATVEKQTILETISLPMKVEPAIAKRIERLGKMEDRRTRALATGNKEALLELAAEYLTLGRHGGCPTMANIISREAEGL